jgi:lysophospholipase L1-like esterase
MANVKFIGLGIVFSLLVQFGPFATVARAEPEPARVPAKSLADKQVSVYGNVEASFAADDADTILKLEFGKGDVPFGGAWFPIDEPRIDNAKCRGIALTVRGSGNAPGRAYLFLKNAEGGAYRSKELVNLFDKTEWSEVVLAPGDFVVDPEAPAEKTRDMPATPKWTDIRRMDFSAVNLDSAPMIEFKAIAFAMDDAPTPNADDATKAAAPPVDPMAKYAGLVLQNNAGNEPLTPFARGIKFPQGMWLERHEKFLALARQGDIDLLWLGDSITDGWNNQKGTYRKLFPDIKSANFGIGGDGTQHLLWRLQNGELDGISPRVAVVLIGTNNIQWHQSAQVATAIERIVGTIREKCPQTRVLLMGIFPRGDLPESSPPQQRIQEVNATIAKLDDGQHVRFLDIRSKLTNPDGKLLTEAFADKVHLSSKGFEIWAESMRPLLDEMMK